MTTTKEKIKRELIGYLNFIKSQITTQENIRHFFKQMSEQFNPKFNSKYDKFIARKSEINIDKISPEIEFVESQQSSELFRNCFSFWSVPVSSGYGRRIRLIIWDKNNYKVMGIVGLCDPVIGMSVRDNYIEWNKEQKKERLYNCMTAYVLGAVPPYNELLGSKLVALLTISTEVVNYFRNKYQNNVTIISGKQKLPELAMIDTMGAFGKSVIYNRLRGWSFVGFSKGYTHYHLTGNGFFNKLVDLLKIEGNEVVKRNKYGEGANWRFRVIGESAKLLNINKDMLYLGVKRGYYISPLAVNWKEFLTMQTNNILYNTYSMQEQIDYWKQRWLIKKIG